MVAAPDWIYFGYYIRPYNIKDAELFIDCNGVLDEMNNATIAWKRSLGVSWIGADGRLDNKIFIARLLEFPRRKKIYGAGYVVTNTQIKLEI